MADSIAGRAPTDSGKSIDSSSGSGGMRGRRRRSSSPRAISHAASPSRPRRSSTDARGRVANPPMPRIPSDDRNCRARGSSGNREMGRGARNAAISCCCTTAPARAACRDAKGAGAAPVAPPHPTGSACRARRITTSRPPCMRSSPSAANAQVPSALGCTAAPMSSRRTVTRSPAARTASGWGGTRSSPGQRASASPTRSPGRTPHDHAAGVQSPITCASPGGGPRAMGSSHATRASITAMRRGRRGMCAVTIMRTYVRMM